MVCCDNVSGAEAVRWTKTVQVSKAPFNSKAVYSLDLLEYAFPMKEVGLLRQPLCVKDRIAA